MEKQLKKSFLITGAIFVVVFILYFSFDYTSDHDRTLLQQISTIPDATQKAAIEQPIRSFINGLREDRQHLFLMDIFRSLIFIAIAGATLWLYQRKCAKTVYGAYCNRSVCFYRCNGDRCKLLEERQLPGQRRKRRSIQSNTCRSIHSPRQIAGSEFLTCRVAILETPSMQVLSVRITTNLLAVITLLN